MFVRERINEEQKIRVMVRETVSFLPISFLSFLHSLAGHSQSLLVLLVLAESLIAESFLSKRWL